MPTPIPASSYPLLMDLINQTYLDRVEQIQSAQVDESDNIIAAAVDGRKLLAVRVSDDGIDIRLRQAQAGVTQFAAPKGKKNCKTGISCGASCISASKTCSKKTTPKQKAQKQRIVADAKAAGEKSPDNGDGGDELDTYGSKGYLISTSAPIGRIQRTPTKFVKGGGSASDEAIEALGEAKKNITPVFVRQTGEKYQVLGNDHVLAASRAAGNDFTWTVALDKAGEKQFAVESEGGNSDVRGGTKKPTVTALGENLGIISQSAVKSLSGKSDADPAVIARIAAELKKTGRNVTPVYVRRVGPDKHEIVGNAHIADAARKAGMDTIWTIPLSDKMDQQRRAEAKRRVS